MITNKIQDAINAQINAEFWSAYLYLSMAMNHANQRGGRVELKAIDAVPTTWASPLEAFKHTLEHEQKVTSLINALYALAEQEHDYATRDRLNWFVTEQVEEEDNCRTLIDKFSMIGDNGMGLYMLDQELGARVYNAPSALAE